MAVSLEILALNRQIRSLKQQSAAASRCAQSLARYKSDLLRSWSGDEAVYFRRSLDAQIQSCRKLATELDQLSRDVTRAMQDLLREEKARSGQGV